jgi:arylsulfatase A-like enzyme
MHLNVNRRDFLKKFGFISAFASMTPHLVTCSKPSKKPNFVFFLVDDLGWMDLGCYGSTFYETPNLDRLAMEGMRFTDAYAACPVCSPTRASIMSGKYPARINLTDWIAGRQNNKRMLKYMKILPPKFNHQMALEEVTIAEALKEDGYKTAFVGKWHLGQTEEFWPEHQGFDFNKGGWSKGAPYGRKRDPETGEPTDDSGYMSPYQNPRLEDGPVGEYLTDRLTDESIKFLKENQGDPFFLYLSFYTVHNPMHGKKEKVDKYKVKAKRMGLDKVNPIIQGKLWMDRPDPGRWQERVIQSHVEYAAMVESMDENIGRVLDTLSELRLDENTAVFFMADNGGLSTSEGSPTSNLPLRGGKGWLYEGGIREPMIIKWTEKVKSGTVCTFPVTSTDFYPTILEMANLPVKTQQHMDGISLVPLLTGIKALNREAIYWHYPHYSNQGDRPGGVVRAGDFKLIEHYEDNQIELYNLREDIGETRDLAQKLPEKATQLKKMLHEWRNSVDAQMPTPNLDYEF